VLERLTPQSNPSDSTRSAAGLQQRGLLTRAAVADHGKALPSELTDTGRVRSRAASVRVHPLSSGCSLLLSPNSQQRLLADLGICAEVLTGEPGS